VQRSGQLSDLLIEAWYSLDVALAVALGVLLSRMAHRVRQSRRPSLDLQLLGGAAARWQVKSANGVTKLQLLVWGVCVARVIDQGLGGHTLIYPSHARTFSFIVVMVVLGSLVVVVLDAAGRLVVLPKPLRWHYDPAVLLILVGLLATCTILLASGWGMASLFAERSVR
jgi:hypothetical protein